VTRPIKTPPTAPASTDHHAPTLTPLERMTKKAAMMNNTAAAIVPTRRATSAGLWAIALTMPMPMTEQTMPVEAMASGRNIRAGRVPTDPNTSMDIVEAMAIVAMMAPQ
jgi:hypothetical protein